MMIVPEAANMPPTPWQTEILAPGIWAGAMPRIWRTLSCSAYDRDHRQLRRNCGCARRRSVGFRRA